MIHQQYAGTRMGTGPKMQVVLEYRTSTQVREWGQVRKWSGIHVRTVLVRVRTENQYGTSTYESVRMNQYVRTSTYVPQILSATSLRLCI